MTIDHDPVFETAGEHESVTLVREARQGLQ